MRALVYDRAAADASATRVADTEEPEPGTGRLTVDVAYAGVNFKDIMVRRGDPGYAPSWPVTPGVEVAGTVRALGPDVTGPEPGTRVVALTNVGGLAEVAAADAALTVPVPAGVDLRTAAAACGAPASAVLLLDVSARVREGDTLLVHSAAGAVGRTLAVVARHRGVATLVGVVGHPDRVAAAERSGYDAVVVRGEGLAARVREHVPAGVDVVLDPQGTAWVADDLDALAPGGRLVVFGNAAGAPLADPPTWRRLFAGNAAVGAFSLEGLSQHAPHRVADAVGAVLDLLAAGRLDLEVTEIDGLAGVPDAHEALAAGLGPGKYVVRV